ncbi:MAG: phage tail protein [Peptococcaceae bacterium]|nr:phage tail protein [Peptococcaceae bacterium]
MITVYDKTYTIKEGGILPSFCVITEELNGAYELEMIHPYDPTGKWQRLIVDKVILADTPKGKQPFRIYNIEPEMSEIKVKARHIFYDLLDNFVRSINSTGTAQVVLDEIKNNLQYSTQFSFSTDIEVSGTVKQSLKNPVEILLGAGDEETPSFIDAFGGELSRNGYNAEMLLAMGEDRGYVISYGKNLTGLTVTEDISTVVTRYMLFGANDVLYGSADSDKVGDYAHPKIAVYQNTDTTSASQLRAEAQALFDAGADLPTVNIKADFVLLQNTEEYKDYAILEEVYLGDVVTVRNRKMNFSKKAKVISYEYDALLKRYNKIELGDFLPNIYSSVTRGENAQVTANAASTAVTQLATTVSQLQEQLNNSDERITALDERVAALEQG